MISFRLTTLALFFVLTSVVSAQYSVSKKSGSPYGAQSDSLVADSATADSAITPSKSSEQLEQDDNTALKSEALTWVRRLIYRGNLDEATTGTSATYALTEWSETSGPFGPVIAHLSVVYLGSVSWLGKPSVWLQATYKSFSTGRPSIDFDLVLAGGDRLGDSYRALWRMNKDELSSCPFDLSSSQFDYDRDDQPRAGDQSTLKLFSGEFSVTKYNGSGAEGSKVIAYLGKDVPPLGLVRLGYGNMSLNLRDRANDVEPKLKVPLPTSR